MTDIKPCTVKGCTSTKQHHHERSSGALFQCPQGGGSRCSRPNGTPWVTPLVAPRLTRKALNARIAALEAENADLHAEIADKKDRLARCEKPATETLANLAQDALRAALRRGDANDATQYVRILDTIVQDGLNALTPDGEVPF